MRLVRLHDNVNQQLTVAMMYIASAEQKCPEGSDLLNSLQSLF